METYYQRQTGLMPPSALRQQRVAVAGCGAVGRQLVLQLVTAGVPDVQFFDFDSVDEVNVGVQGWAPLDVGMRKVDALRSQLDTERRSQEQEWVAGARHFPLDLTDVDTIFLCVDSIDARREIFEAYKGTSAQIIDARVAAESIRILTASCSEEGRDYYASTLFSQSQAYVGNCTSRMTIFQANIAAGLMMQQFSLGLRDLPTEKDVQLNLLSMEMYTLT